jgi:hypothetical protein
MSAYNYSSDNAYADNEWNNRDQDQASEADPSEADPSEVYPSEVYQSEADPSEADPSEAARYDEDRASEASGKDEEKKYGCQFVEIEYYAPQIVVFKKVNDYHEEELVYKLEMIKTRAIVEKYQKYITRDNVDSGIYEEIKVGRTKYHKVCKNPYNDGLHVMNLLYGTGLALDSGRDGNKDLDCDHVIITSVKDL